MSAPGTAVDRRRLRDATPAAHGSGAGVVDPAAAAAGPRVRVVAPGVSGADLTQLNVPRNAPGPKVTGWPKGRAKVKSESKKPRKKPRPRQCSLCGKVGHDLRVCPKRESRQPRRAPAAKRTAGGGQTAAFTPASADEAQRLIELMPEAARADLMMAVAAELHGRLRFTVSMAPANGRRS